MKIINDALPIPLVLHGGSGIPNDKIETAIACGISKVNINTDLQIAWCKAVREKLDSDKEVYDPRKVIGSGENAMKNRIKELVLLFKTRL
jgi:fructose/tagatose bisphosphate aldolase